MQAPTGQRKSRDEIAQAYKSEPWWYDVRGFFILTFAYNDTLFNQFRLFGPNFGGHHLELACGTGTLLQLLLKWRRWKGLPESSIVGIDYAESMLAGARHRFHGQSGLRFEHADAASLPFGDASFDTINIANAVHCLPDVDAVLREAWRVLRPGGTMAVNVLLYPRGIWPFDRIAHAINEWGARKGILVTPYQEATIRARFLAAGFQIATEGVSGNCYNVVFSKT